MCTCRTKLLVVAQSFLAVQPPEDRVTFHQHVDFFFWFRSTAAISEYLCLIKEDRGEMGDCASA